MLFLGIVLFAAYIYKFDPLTTFTQLFSTDAGVIWSALGVIVTGIIGAITFRINVSLREVQERQADIQDKQADIAYRQDQLYSEPHIMLESIKVIDADVEFTEDKRQIKGVKGFDSPYFVNRNENLNFDDLSIVVISFQNTSEAFARLRFKEATITKGAKNAQSIAVFNGSTFGFSTTQVMLNKGESASIGLVIGTSKVSDLHQTEITISTYLDNNFKETYLDTQIYHISGVCEGNVRFMPWNMRKNEFRKIEKGE